MGNTFSRCVQNVRSTLLTCSRKHNEDEPMLTSTYDSEAHDKYNGPCLDPSVSLIDRCGGEEVTVSHGHSESSLVKCADRMERSECHLKSSTPKSQHGSRGYKTLPSDDDTGNLYSGDGGRLFVDVGIQTSCVGDPNTPSEPQAGLSKEFIIKTYSIKNATPSPTIPTKFLPKDRPRPTDVFGPPSPQPGDSSLSSAQMLGSSQSQRQLLRLSSTEKTSNTSSAFNTPAANLLHRQEEALKKLEDLQSSVTKMAQKYNVSTSSTSSTSHSTKLPTTTPKSLGTTLHDIVVNVDPSSIPLSLILLCEQLSKQYTVFKSTFVHSSVTDQVPDKLLQLLSSNGLSRIDSQLSIVLVWKKVTHGPQLIVDPTRQTPISGEANVVRYLARLLNPSFDDSHIFTATQINDFLDLAQLQLIEGNSKEKAAAVRSLNSALGKQSWLVGEDPSIADYVCWSALQQASLTEGSPANVKKWLGLCNRHPSFSSAVKCIG